MDHSLTTCDKGKAPGTVLMRLCDGSQKRTGLPGLTGETVSQNNRIITQITAGPGSRSAKVSDTARNHGLHIGQFLGRLLLKKPTAVI